MDNCKEKIDLGHYWDLKGLRQKIVCHTLTIKSVGGILHGVTIPKKPLWKNFCIIVLTTGFSKKQIAFWGNFWSL